MTMSTEIRGWFDILGIKAAERRSCVSIPHVLDNNAYNPIETKAVMKVIA